MGLLVSSWRRLLLTLLPWAVASAGVFLSVDSLAFHKSEENLLAPPPESTPPPAPEHQPTPKSEERVIDPSEHVNV